MKVTFMLLPILGVLVLGAGRLTDDSSPSATTDRLRAVELQKRVDVLTAETNALQNSIYKLAEIVEAVCVDQRGFYATTAGDWSFALANRRTDDQLWGEMFTNFKRYEKTAKDFRNSLAPTTRPSDSVGQ